MTARSCTKNRQRGAKDIEAYLSALPEDRRQALQSIRKAVLAAAPDAEEAFVYGMPGVKLHGKSLVCYAGFKNHCGFYPMSPDVIRAHALQLKKFEIAKGTIRFQADKSLPAALVKRLVKARAAEVRGSNS